MFVTDDGQNVLFTFLLLILLFALWGFCNGMIDVMDKHFQEVLHLSLSQSASVQFAHYLGYFLMALPAGWLASKLGYKGGIIAGLLLVALGGFWFIPATHIGSFWAFLLGVCIIAAGLTFLETSSAHGLLRHRTATTAARPANRAARIRGATRSAPRQVHGSIASLCRILRASPPASSTTHIPRRPLSPPLSKQRANWLAHHVAATRPAYAPAPT
jgi:MFS family permease